MRGDPQTPRRYGGAEVTTISLGDADHPGQLPDRLLGDAPLVLPLGDPAERQVAVRADDGEVQRLGRGVGEQGGIRLGGEAQVAGLPQRLRGRPAALGLKRALDHPDPGRLVQPVRVEDEIVEKRIVPVDVVKELHPSRALPVALPHEVRGRVGVDRQPALDPLDPDRLGRGAADPQGVAHRLEQERRAAA